MNPEEKGEYIRYRLGTSKKTYEAAKVLAENGYWNSSVNRLYYAVFYSVSALLYLYDIPAKKHSTLKSQFSLHFIKTGIFDKKIRTAAFGAFRLASEGRL
ncbi:MAG: HEPN domain-containing protein [Bacteroidota bacterium]